ncbi:MAG: helix-turn-helix transcriptional regulator [Lachnospiraceae bacterium]|nr:helix-turn-helix transcriptional regulator [Lachnospiraceae bacterium]
MQERIKMVRKMAKLSQEEFGKILEITKASISRLESGINNPSDQTVRLICDNFNIDEHWLRTGEGSPEITKTRSEVIAEFAGSLMKDEEDSFRRRLIEVLAELDVDEWKLLEKIAKKATRKD